MLSKDQINVEDLLNEVQRLKKECEQVESQLRTKAAKVENAKKELEMIGKWIDEAYQTVNEAHKRVYGTEMPTDSDGEKS